MSDSVEFTSANVGEDRPQQWCDDVDRWIGADDEKKIREGGIDEVGPGGDDDGVVQFHNWEEDWYNVGVDEPGHYTDQGKKGNDKAEFEEPRKDGEGIKKVRKIRRGASDFSNPDRDI